jgi:tetratricopeptide (TPR) repeat protein
VLLILCIASFSLADILRNRDIAAVEDLGSRYESLRPSITEESSADDVSALIEDIRAFAKKRSGIIAIYTGGYAGGRAWSILGSIYSETKNWAEAETAWAAAAQTAKKTYLAPLALFNAGVAAEEQGKTEEAIGYYSDSLASEFPSAPRAQFAIGRLNESLNENSAAIEAYRAVISRWPHDKVWTSFAHNRIIALESK